MRKYLSFIFFLLSLLSISIDAEEESQDEPLRTVIDAQGKQRAQILDGAVLIYDPVSKQAYLWPFGHQTFPSFTLSPDNSLIQSPTGQQVDRSDVGALYQSVQALWEHGTIELPESGPVNGDHLPTQSIQL
ncbi:exported hypothetical protein [Gammaproteobacteria bacterium]